MNEKNNIAPKNEEINVVKYETENIKNLIYTIRGKQVMIDSDVAMLYQCETKYVNRVVKRNIERFPEEFCFQLTEKESQNLRCQFVTSSFEKQNYGGRRYLPYVFTEQGIAMLSALLKSEIAVKVSINIMKAFIENSNITQLDIQKFNKQYPILKLGYTNKFHDRFIVIDNKELYHCGASLKDLGKKCFAISKIEDMEYVEKITKFN